MARPPPQARTRRLPTPGTPPADGLARLLIANLPAVADALDAGAIAALAPSAIRVRTLPLP